MGVLSYSPLTGGWLSGRWRKDTGQQASSRASRLPERFDLSQPANQRKLDAVEELAQLADDTGITLIQMAIAFVLNHPAITSAIIGPRTMEQLEGQLAAADVVLDHDVLDRIDEIVAARHDRQPGRQLLRQPAHSRPPPADRSLCTPLRPSRSAGRRPTLRGPARCVAPRRFGHAGNPALDPTGFRLVGWVAGVAGRSGGGRRARVPGCRRSCRPGWPGSAAGGDDLIDPIQDVVLDRRLPQPAALRTAPWCRGPMIAEVIAG